MLREISPAPRCPRTFDEAEWEKKDWEDTSNQPRKNGTTGTTGSVKYISGPRVPMAWSQAWGGKGAMMAGHCETWIWPQRPPLQSQDEKGRLAGTCEVHKRVPAQAANDTKFAEGMGVGCYHNRHPSLLRLPKYQGRPRGVRMRKTEPVKFIANLVPRPPGEGGRAVRTDKCKSCPHPVCSYIFPPGKTGVRSGAPSRGGGWVG